MSSILHEFMESPVIQFKKVGCPDSYREVNWLIGCPDSYREVDWLN